MLGAIVIKVIVVVDTVFLHLTVKALKKLALLLLTTMTQALVVA
jgi:hypothetical protein